MKRFDHTRIAGVVFLAVTLLIGCSTSKRLAENPRITTAQSAIGYFSELLTDGKLPGIQKGEHGHFKTDFPNQEIDFQYPQRITFQVLKEKEPSLIHWYILERKSNNDPWQLVEAWKSDQNNGNRVDLFRQIEAHSP